MVLTEQPDHKDLKVLPEQRVIQEVQVLRVLPEQKVVQETPDHKVLREQRVQGDLQEQRDLRDLKVLPEKMVVEMFILRGNRLK
jgi:hypothetical protein